MNLYANDVPAPYIPATWKGSWDKTSTNNGTLDARKLGYVGNNNTTASNSENVSTNPYRVGIIRLVGRKLAPQTISGTLDMVMSVLESNLDANFFTSIYAYVTQGDSDLVRGVLLDYSEDAGTGTEWTTTSTGKAFTSPQALSPLAVLEGDRLVIEFGFKAFNGTAINRTGTTRVGNRDTDLNPLVDLTDGSTSVTTRAGFFVFSNPLILSASEPTNVDPESATLISTTPFQSIQNPVNVTTPLWFKKIATISDNASLSVFAGVNQASGNYFPALTSLHETGGLFNKIHSGSPPVGKVEIVTVTVGDSYYFGIVTTSLGADANRSLVMNVLSGPALPADNKDNFLISADSTGSFGAVVNRLTGEIVYATAFPESETGAINDDGIICIDDDQSTTNINLYNRDLTLITIVNTVKPGGANNPAIGTDGTNFFVISFSGLNIVINKINPAGSILNTWITPLAAHLAPPNYCTISSDGSIIYYTAAAEFSISGTPIHAYNLNTSTPLPDFVPGEATKYFKNLHIQRSSGNLITQVQNESLTLSEVRIYNSSGVLQTTYNPTTTLSPFFLDHIALSRDELSFWAWFQDGTFSEFRRYLISNGSLQFTTPLVPLFQGGYSAESFANVDEPDYYFGVDDSCPFLVMDTPEAPTGTLIINKIVSSAPDTTTEFDIQVGGGLFPANITLKHGEFQQYNGVAAGTYSVFETPPSGWNLISIVVSNGSPSTAITVASGEIVTVTITNYRPVTTASGIYELIENKRQDTLWVDTTLGTTREAKIP